MAEKVQTATIKPEDLPILEIPGKAKAAILLIFLGPETSGYILQSLSDVEIEILTIEIAKARKITTEEKLSVLFEFEQLMMARKFYSEGGLEYAKHLLENHRPGQGPRNSCQNGYFIAGSAV